MISHQFDDLTVIKTKKSISMYDLIEINRSILCRCDLAKIKTLMNLRLMSFYIGMILHKEMLNDLTRNKTIINDLTQIDSVPSKDMQSPPPLRIDHNCIQDAHSAASN